MKEFLYVGHYIDTCGNYILKIGTTKDLDRRKKEHERNYRKSPQYTLGANDNFEYDFVLPLSKYNTLRYEDSNKLRWKSQNIGQYVRNDRFNCGGTPPNSVTIQIRKTYTVDLTATPKAVSGSFAGKRAEFRNIVQVA